MDPVTTALASLASGHIAGKACDNAISLFRHNVIERWSRYRAEQFFDQLCCELRSETDGTLKSYLDHLRGNDSASERLFDAYRSVTLSRSKILGPKFIAVIVARTLVEDRNPTAYEASMMNVAEEFDDDEFRGFADFVRQTRDDIAKGKDASVDERGVVKIRWCDDELELNRSSHVDFSASPLNLYDSHGSWAVKMERLDILRTDLTDRIERREQPYAEAEPDHVRHRSLWVLTDIGYFEFGDIIHELSLPNATKQCG